jgi:hypothetical protein
MKTCPVGPRTQWDRAAHARRLDLGERDLVIEDLQSRVTEFEHLKQHVLELEERVDFAERLPSQQRETPRIGTGLSA